MGYCEIYAIHRKRGGVQTFRKSDVILVAEAIREDIGEGTVTIGTATDTKGKRWSGIS